MARDRAMASATFKSALTCLGCLLLALFMSLPVKPAISAPAFEIAVDKQMQGSVKKSVKKSEPFQCLAACLEEDGFKCKAVDYNPATQACRLSDRTNASVSASGVDMFTVTDDGKGLGSTKCFSGGEKSGALCYKKCRAGYVGRGPVCWQKCPQGYKNDGATCRLPVNIVKRESKGRGAGKPMGCAGSEEKDGALCYKKCKSGYKGVGPVCWQTCPSGYQNDGATCRLKGDIFSKKSYGRGRGKVRRKNCDGECEKDAGLWYPKCKEGYNGRGPVCWQYCPSGYKNDGATCRKPVKIVSKKSYGRGVGKAVHACGSGQEKDAALCYPKCPAGFKGVGPVCWKSCPNGYKTDGATCRKPGKIVAKKSYGRGVGHLQRGNYRRIFFRYIRDHRNVNLAYGKPLTASEKAYLAQFFPKRLIDKVRVVMKKRRTGFGNYTAGATTYGNDLIVIKQGERSNELLKHEMVHVCQYDKLGQQGFAHAYADQYVESNYDYNKMSFEEDAYGYVNRSERINAYLGADNSRGAIYAACK
jgi:hypothetical protein